MLGKVALWRMIQIDKIRNVRELRLDVGVIMIGFGYLSCSVLIVCCVIYTGGLLV